MRRIQLKKISSQQNSLHCQREWCILEEGLNEVMSEEKDESLAQGHPKFDEAVDEVVKEILAMTQEEFDAELEKHKDGDIAQFLMETGAINYIMEDINKRKKKMDNSATYLIERRIKELEFTVVRADAEIGTHNDIIASYEKRKLEVTKEIEELREALTMLSV
jgi:hypothetical protein